MWPFKKKQPTIQSMPPDAISYSQLDITENFDDHLHLSPEDWIETIPLNASVKNPESVGLPSTNATLDEIFFVASKLSSMRESFPIPNDGVYCPICHIANISISKLRTPCPKCGRFLLKFGWD